MASFTSFEEIRACQLGRRLTTSIYRASRGASFARDQALKHQIRRAAISITSNIAEGFERNSDRAFLHFLSIAKASVGELRSQLYVALVEGYISNDQFLELYDLADETSRQIGGLMRYLRKKPSKSGQQ